MTTLFFDDKSQRDEMYASMRKDKPLHLIQEVTMFSQYTTPILSEDKGRYLLTVSPPAPRPSPKPIFRTRNK